MTAGPPGVSRRRVLRSAGSTLGALWLPAWGQPPVRTEVVEAAYLHKLPGFVEWPAQAFASATAPIVVGVAGSPPVLEELARIAKGRPISGRTLEARSVEGPADVPKDLQVLFIGSRDERSARALVDAARARHALIVTDMPEGLSLGAAVQFVQVDGRLRFKISLTGASACGLKLSSQLMGVALKVTENGG